MPEPIAFIGREDELNKISDVIEHSDQSHIFCIDGPGGIGKTRLLQEIQQKYLQPKYSIIREPIKRKDVTITILQEFTDDEWSEEFTAGVRDMAAKLDIKFSEFDAQHDIDNMVELLNAIISSSPDVLIIRHGTNEQLRPLLEQANEHNIKVLAFDNLLQKLPALTTRVIHEEEAGMRLSLELLAKDINYQGEIIIAGVKGTESHERRKKYLLETLEHEFPDISMIQEFSVRQREIGEDECGTVEEIRNLFKKHPNVKAFWATWNTIARNVIQAIIEEKRTDIKVYSFDFSTKDIDGFLAKESPWQATVTTDPRESGAIIMRLATQAAYGHPIKRHYRLTSRLLTQLDIKEHARNPEYLQGQSEIGWTAWMKSLYEQKSYSEKHIVPLSEIIDFDDLNLLNPLSLGMTLAKHLNSNLFEPFFQAQTDYQKMQEGGTSQERLKEEEKRLNKEFADCVNEISKQKRIVLFFDTSERLKKEEEIWNNLKDKLAQLENVVVLLAGRNAETLNQSLQTSQFPYPIHLIRLSPLSKVECRKYLQEKQKRISLKLGFELEEKLLVLAQGKPILLDLAVEWRARGISLQWVFEEQIEKWESLPEKRQWEFEKYLLMHFQEMRSTINELIVLMAYIFPVNTAMIAELFPKEHAEELFEELKGYVFVKQLPNNYIKLHDEMERMLQTHIWPDIDPDEGRRKWYSKRIIPYLEHEIQRLSLHIESQRERLIALERVDQKTEVLMLSLSINEAEQNLWYFKEQYLNHTLRVECAKAIFIFDSLFHEATKSSAFFSLRKKLFEKVFRHYNEMSPVQQVILDISQIQLCYDDGKYEDVEAKCKEVLQKADLTVEQQIDLYLKRANAKTRVGDLRTSIQYFEQAKKLAETSRLPIWVIKTTNALGWIHRLRGDLKRAQKYYLEARRLCFDQEKGPKNPFIRDDYGWILNNLAFVYSNSSATRETAVSIALSAIEHWKSIRNDIGLAAGYSMLGIAYYRNDKPESAFEAFYKAEKLSKTRDDKEGLGLIYAWRGNLFRIIHKLDEAEHDLKKALDIGSHNIKAMTHCRLGRLYMSQKKWTIAIGHFKKSIQFAQEIPDYLYWLVSIARLIMIAAEQQQYSRFDEYNQQLQTFLDLLKQEDMEPDQNNLGIAKIGLARMVFRQNDNKKVETIVALLKQGISLVVEYGWYANRDGVSRLSVIEQDFHKISSDIIRSVGQQLVDFVIHKELENIAYSSATQMMYKWANWKVEESSHEA
ncbi:TPR repeat protein [Candidatus Vecturithrix granuli]|uniref:TPR repeat protein n=1 Tax=Vecturithrix granuli TaxID=1499967 RepID=A0A081BYA9_VECG1|nr:TPR repeat protein [Candidatus Vecturithrix granuli]